LIDRVSNGIHGKCKREHEDQNMATKSGW
jgi:hypothetical protein